MENNLKPIFSGIQKFTLIDFKNNLSAVLFTGGCNFRCPYCHNPDLVIPKKIEYKKSEEIINFLNSRKNKLSGIVICGGEPTIHSNNLYEWIKYIKNLGFKIKLDTNGTNPTLVEKLLNEKLIDSIAIDYKSNFENYSKIINNPNINQIIINNIIHTLKLIIKESEENNLEYEIRTTIHSNLHSIEDIKKIVTELKNLKIKKYHLQLYKETNGTIEKLPESYYTHDQINNLKKLLVNNFEESSIRNI